MRILKLSLSSRGSQVFVLASPPDPMRILKQQAADGIGGIDNTCITTRSDEDTETLRAGDEVEVSIPCITTRSDEDTETRHLVERQLQA